MYWVAYDKIGKLIEVSETELTNISDESFVINVEGDIPDLTHFKWNTGLLKFEIDENQRVLTKLQFMNRFTPEERIQIRTLAKSDPMIEDFMELLALAEEVNLDDPNTIRAIQYLTYLNVLTPEQAQQILL